MPLTNDQVFKHASDAVEQMFNKHGPDFTFPFDRIWQHTPAGLDIPSTSRPHQSRRLIAEGFIEKTGAMTRAASEQRAGSATPEYRFGRKLRSVSTAQAMAASSDRPGHMLAELQKAMDAEGYIISTAELANFYLAMMVSPLVILSGISGTGKSLLPRQFAKHTGSGFHAIPVQPQWSDNTDMFGYVPTLAPSKYIRGRVVPSLQEAANNPKKLVIVLLDEMNLAPVEHYFSDFLSVAETWRREQGIITTDRLPIELPDLQSGGEDPYQDLRDIRLPPNLRMVGTANMDETTKAFSPKVLDRAFTIEFDDPDLTEFAILGNRNTAALNALALPLVDPSRPISVHEARLTSQDLFDHVSGLLNQIQRMLAPAGIKFGYRTRDAILMYLRHWQELSLGDILSDNAALDFCLLQKVLPKIVGTGDVLSEALDNLTAWLKIDRNGRTESSPLGFNGPFTRSLQKAERMKALLETDGATHYWGV